MKIFIGRIRRVIPPWLVPVVLGTCMALASCGMRMWSAYRRAHMPPPEGLPSHAHGAWRKFCDNSSWFAFRSSHLLPLPVPRYHVLPSPELNRIDPEAVAVFHEYNYGRIVMVLVPRGNLVFHNVGNIAMLGDCLATLKVPVRNEVDVRRLMRVIGELSGAAAYWNSMTAKRVIPSQWCLFPERMGTMVEVNLNDQDMIECMFEVRAFKEDLIDVPPEPGTAKQCCRVIPAPPQGRRQRVPAAAPRWLARPPHRKCLRPTQATSFTELQSSASTANGWITAGLGGAFAY